ncbi:hypothetical protein [Actinoplanes auranticolor]|uniref:Uncharacterized protein n=1 Tax=Actinoplanes auranticolor TaxID=47988 RepID=A0A919SBE8_9ACTN|nr:hypothetical protein [Actinoplanes auranticolor]GIM67892.1 hypothetical protein Aau02nite_29270 [Actinoplanes auranticolor]
MGVTLSGGIRPKPGHRVVAAGPVREPARPAPGTPVAVGPAATTDVTEVLARLRELVAAGGVVAAGADVDLGAGFRSARIAGGAGDRRDAVLAALAVPDIAGRVGPPPALLVALFGPDATRPLGAAAREAITAGRWPVLRYAVAAADLLGPEQLVRLLALRAPPGVDPFPSGLPSVVGSHLGRVLGPLSGARRLRLLTDLWEQVCAAGLDRLRRDRLRDSQRTPAGHDDLRARAQQFERDEILLRLRRRFGPEPTLVQAALWEPPPDVWSARAARVLSDALAATVLARLATTAVDQGYPEALHRHSDEIVAAIGTLTKREAVDAGRPVPGLVEHPSRPVSYLRDLRRIPAGGPLSPKQTRYVRDRLALARDYGMLALENALTYVVQDRYDEDKRAHPARRAWAAGELGPWREQVGYFSPARLAGWEQAPDGGLSAGTETVGHLFWYAELADALARLRGNPAAELTFSPSGPYADPQADPPDDPLAPRLDAVAPAAAGTAQLAELGGTVPPRPRTWADVVGGLLTGVAAAEAQPGRFAVPEPAEAADGTLLPGTDLRIEVARTGRQLARWAGYMGNCIAGPEYADGAAVGRQVLVALCAPGGRIVANVAVRLTGKGWRIGEMKARFNEDPDDDLVRRTREWIASLPVPEEEFAPARAEPLLPVPPRRAQRPAPAARLMAEVGERLGELAEAALRPSPLLAALIDAEPGPEALVALRRSSPATLIRGCRRLLTGVEIADLWEASAHRPLSEAVAALPAAVRDRLAPLGADVPIPRTLRRVARLPQVAPARNAELVAIRMRAAIGELLREDAPELARAMAGRPPRQLLRAGVLTVTSWGGLRTAGPVTAVTGRRRIRVPGYPQSSLKDESWQAAWPDAVGLGAVPEDFWDRIAGHGALVPSSWLGGGDWPALWGRATR